MNLLQLKLSDLIEIINQTTEEIFFKKNVESIKKNILVFDDRE